MLLGSWRSPLLVSLSLEETETRRERPFPEIILDKPLSWLQTCRSLLQLSVQPGGHYYASLGLFLFLMEPMCQPGPPVSPAQASGEGLALPASAASESMVFGTGAWLQ